MSRVVLVCTRRSDIGAPRVKSRLGRCKLCKSRVWIAASSPKADEIQCRQCAAETFIHGDKAEPLTERQIAEIKKALAL